MRSAVVWEDRDGYFFDIFLNLCNLEGKDDGFLASKRQPIWATSKATLKWNENLDIEDTS